MLKLLIFSLVSIKVVLSANILFLSAGTTTSHHIWNRALAFGLVNKGHNLTLIGLDEDKVTPENYTQIYIKGLHDELHEAVDVNGLASYGPLEMAVEYAEICITLCESILKSEGFETLLNYPPDFKFDLIIIDITFGSCLYPFIQRFNYPPTVGVTAFLLPAHVGFNFGNHVYPAYIPWYGLPYNKEMSFVERFWNFVYMYYDITYRNFREYKKEHELAKKAFGEDIPTMEELERHISLVLTNTDPVLDQPQPLAPHFIPVGGLHTRKSKVIPKDLLDVLNGAKNGAIVFSLGTNVRSDKLDNKTQKALLDAFRKIPQTVIWKFESDIDNLPKNVIVRKWLPQNDILGHPNVKLFIGHGGALSTQEAMFHGVPIICVPFFMDQHVNTRLVVDRKLGVHLDFQKITADYVLDKLKEVLDNPEYAENMRQTSRRFRDRTETPLERGIFWIEYALKHGGTHFLNTPARDLPFYKSSSLDVIGFLVFIVAVILILICKLLRIIFTFSRSKKKVKLN